MTALFDCLQPLLQFWENDPCHIRGARPVPHLPQVESSRGRSSRDRELSAMRRLYQYDHQQVPGVAMVRTLPRRERPSLDWLLLAIEQGLVVIENVLELLGDPSSGVDPKSDHVSRSSDRLRDLRDRHTGILERRQARSRPARVEPTLAHEVAAQPLDTAVFGGDGAHLLWRDGRGSSSCCTCGLGWDRVDRIASATVEPCVSCLQFEAVMLIDELKSLTLHLVETLLSRDRVFGRPADIADYDRQFRAMPIPALGDRIDGVARFETDTSFAWRQVAGQNPMAIALVTDLTDLRTKIPITAGHLRQAVGGDLTLTDAVKASRLFAVDYGFSADARCSEHPSFAGPKYIGSPIGVFALDDDRVLVPVAITCTQGSDDAPVITPSDGNWDIAKAVFDNAAGNNSEFVQHLGYAHLLIGAVAIAAARTLPSRHPLSVLLSPHFDGTLFANYMAQSGMNEPPELNVVGAEISATIEDTLAWTAGAVAEVDLREWSVPKLLERNGTADPDVLPTYPYRDDALRVWGAIREWVESYVHIYYHGDADVVADDEIQAFAAECSSPDQGCLHGVGDGGRFDSVESLVETLAVVVYQASAHHASTNFPLQEVELYAPALPLALYMPPPTETEGGVLLDYLPPLEISLIQQSLYFVIGTVHYTQLGVYPHHWFADDRVDAPLSAFRARLAALEAEIGRDNRSRFAPYIYLLPSRIPQSINI